jgi:hypothetical protein
VRRHELRIRWDAIAFRHNDDIPRHDLAAGNTALHAVTDDESPWAGKIAQALEDTLRLKVLIDDNTEVDHRQHRKQRTFVPVSNYEVDRRRSDQQQKQRFPKCFQQHAQKIAAIMDPELVGTISSHSLGGFSRSQSLVMFCHVPTRVLRDCAEKAVDVAVAPQRQHQPRIGSRGRASVIGGRAPLERDTGLRKHKVERWLWNDLVGEHPFNGLPVPGSNTGRGHGDAKPDGPLEYIDQDEICGRIAYCTEFDVIGKGNVGLATPQREPVLSDRIEGWFESLRQSK